MFKPLRRQPAPAALERLSLADLVAMKFSGNSYGLQQSHTSWRDGERPDPNFAGHVTGAYQADGVVFACILARLLVFAEARFSFRRYVNGRPGDLFGDSTLNVLERPWPNGTTGELLARMEQDASLAGNSFWTRRGDRLVRLRPDRVTIVSGSTGDPDTAEVDSEVIGYAYDAGQGRTVLFDVGEVAHYSPIPDPLCSWRGMSWLTPVLTEISADKAATEHKWRFFENGATPNLVVKADADFSANDIADLRKQLDARFAGVGNAYSTMVLGAGLDAQVVGANLQQMDFKITQGAGETRIAAAAGVPPVIVGLSEGLQAATYSNYAQARRRFADGTIRPLWRIAASSLETIVPPPDGAHLWYDDRDIAFLREDAKDRADMLGVDALTVRTLIDAGWDPDAAVLAVTTGDLRTLAGKHTGLTSAQLQAPATGKVA